MFRLDDKLARIRSGAYRRSDFIIADAKDPDMGPGLHAVGPAPTAEARDFARVPNSSIRSRRSSSRTSSTSC